MVNFTKPQFEEPFQLSSSFDHRISSNTIIEDVPRKKASVVMLNSRIGEMRSHLQILKEQVERERMLLEEERIRTMYSSDNFRQDKDDVLPGSPPDYCRSAGPSPTRRQYPNLEADHSSGGNTLSEPSKRHLKDIEKQCDKELVRLQNYISNIGELKNHWKCFMEESKWGEFQSGERADAAVKGSFSDEYIDDGSTAYYGYN